MKITITRQDERRGNVTRMLEFERENLSMSEIIGALDGLMRQCWPEDMRRRTLNLSNRTDGGRDRDVGVSPVRVRPMWQNIDEEDGLIPSPSDELVNSYILPTAAATTGYINNQGIAVPPVEGATEAWGQPARRAANISRVPTTENDSF